jgi:hypothetical protein
VSVFLAAVLLCACAAASVFFSQGGTRNGRLSRRMRRHLGGCSLLAALLLCLYLALTLILINGIP